jgi:DNA primase
VSLQPESILAAIKQANPIVSLVAEYLHLHRTGNTYKALCPFHDDHNPSLILNSERQSYKCWSCGAGGDVISFVMAIERIEFPEALRMLAERAGIALEKEPVLGDGPKGPSKTDLLAACKWAEACFADAWVASPEARLYTAERGISPESIERFNIGFAPDSRDWLSLRARKAGFGQDVLESAGLLGRKEGTNLTYDRFRGRLIFPIHDTRSRPIAFGGRILPESEKRLADDGQHIAKYLNSPETPLFQKRRNLFAADLARTAARTAGWVAVVEGYTDVIAAHQAGLENVVGTLGTALGDDHVTALRSLADRVVLIFDGDEAGQKAVDRSLELFLGHEVDVRVLTLPDRLDPADFLAANGADEFRRLVDRASDPLDFIIDRSAGRYDLYSPEGARLAAQWVLSILAKVPKNGRGGLDLKVAKALDTLSRRLGVPIADLRREMRRVANPPRLREPLPSSEVSEKQEEAPVDLASLDPLDLETVRIALNEVDSVAILQRVVPSDALRDATLRGILQACYDLLAEGERPDFDRASFRLSDRERVLAAGLLLPFDRSPMSEGLRPASWLDRLQAILPRLELRRWENVQRELKAALQETDRTADPVLYQALSAEYLKHLSRRPGPKPK